MKPFHNIYNEAKQRGSQRNDALAIVSSSGPTYKVITEGAGCGWEADERKGCWLPRGSGLGETLRSLKYIRRSITGVFRQFSPQNYRQSVCYTYASII